MFWKLWRNKTSKILWQISIIHENIDSISEFQGKKLKHAISKAQDSIIKKNNAHNEINMLNPKINAFVAKVDSIDEIPQSFLEFVQKHNLPIYLLGK